MIPKHNAKISKGIIFAGCSFTWGQGLYYYSNMPTLQEPLPDHYDPKLVTDAHLLYKNKIRYPRLVADHFDTWELVHPHNGGSNHSAIKWFKNLLTNKMSQENIRYELLENHHTAMNKHNADKPPHTYDFSEISYVFLQLTQFWRNNFVFTHKGERHDIPFSMVAPTNTENEHLYRLFYDYLESNNIELEDWINQYQEDNMKEVKDFLMLCENNGCKTGLLTWPEHNLPLIKKDNWLTERFITLEYKNSVFDSIEQLMQNHRECEIKHDYENFTETPKDHHPSKICHRIIANSLINYINEKSLP